MIKLLTEYFYPEIASTAQLMTQLAVGLKDSDFEVEVYTSQPTYQGQERGILPFHEIYKGVKINRLSSTQFNKNIFFGRIINWITFTGLTIWKLLFRSNSKDILLILSNPPILPFGGLMLNILRGQRYIPIIYDIYPDIAEELGVIKKNNFLASLWKSKNRLLLEKAISIIVPGKKMKEKLLEDYGEIIEGDKLNVIHNWEDGDFIRPIDKKKSDFARTHGYDEKLTVLYSGNLGLQHDLETLILAADKLQDLPVQLVFIGEGIQKDKLIKMVEERNLNNVDFHPYQPYEKLPDTLAWADIAVVSEKKEVSRLCCSCKIYSALAGGQAVLGLVGENSDVAKILDLCSCGFRVDPYNVEEIVDKIRYWNEERNLLEEMKRKARRCFKSNFTFQHSLDKYVEVLKNSDV